MLRPFAIAAGLAFAAFVTVKGIPTLRHDWNWPIDRIAVPSFFNESIGGWVPAGLGALNAHPTTYLVAIPMALAMWLVGPLATLTLLAVAIGYLCVRGAQGLSQRWNFSLPATVGIGLFALFNPWVYSEVVAGHLVMVLAYAGIIGLFAEMLGGKAASPVRLALWLALVESQLQFFIVAMLAVVAFALFTRKWLPPIAGAAIALPSVIGLIAEHATIVDTPYSLSWQANQSVAPAALAALGGYFPGYADRLGPAAAFAVWTVLALALFGAVAARRSRLAIVAAAAAVVLYVVIAGVHGPLAVPYEWIVRRVPESGVFRELYDLAGILAALLAVLACAATGAVPRLGYAALAAGVVLPVTWLLAPPSDFWVGAASYPHPTVSAPPFTRIALSPAFQPLMLRDGRGDGADPDAHVYPAHATAVNEYFPTYPVDMALASYEQHGDVAPLRALGVVQIVPRPWLSSRSNGNIGLAAASLTPQQHRDVPASIQYVADAIPLISTCEGLHIVALAHRLGSCEVFFGDAGPGYPSVTPLRARTDSIDPQTDWIDARLSFAGMPALAQGVGGVVTQSRVAYPVEYGVWLLAYVRGALLAPSGRTLATGRGEFRWISLPHGVSSVTCAGLCELVAETRSMPKLTASSPQGSVSPLPFRRILPWLYVVRGSLHSKQLLRLNERYDAAWTALNGGRVLPHVRVDMAVNGWFKGEPTADTTILIQVTSFLQIIAEICGLACLLWLLKAVAREPTKRAG
jgi:hypothetical protein